MPPPSPSPRRGTLAGVAVLVDLLVLEQVRGHDLPAGRGPDLRSKAPGRAALLAARGPAAQIGPTLKARGLYFVGLDIIGDYLTEINVTSPTCLREIEAESGLDIAGQLLDSLPVGGLSS